MEKKSFNPSEHIVWPENPSEHKEIPDAFNPESFISLEAVVDTEKARIAAEAVHQRLKPLFEDLATAELMLAEARDEEDRNLVEEEIKEIRRRIKEEIDKKTITSPFSINTILHSSKYSTLAYWYHKQQGSKIIRGMPPSVFSADEKKLIKHYDEIAGKKALEFLSEASEDQRKILSFLVSRGFHISVPEAPGVDEEDTYLFGELFCVVAERVTSYSLPNESDEVLFEEFKKRFLEKYNEYVSFRGGKKPFDAETYLADPAVSETLRLWRHFGIETAGPKFAGVGVKTQNPRTGELEPGEAQFSRSLLGIRYDATDIRRVLKEKAEEFIVPGTSEYIEIISIPFSRELGNDLSLPLQKIENLNNLLKENPGKALDRMGRGDNWVFSNFQLSKLFGEQKNEKKRSASYLFLGIEKA